MNDFVVPAAGRELDALVAERVMGFAHRECRAAEEDIWISDDGVLWFQLPAYSSDISAAWSVVERLKERGDVFIEWWSDGTWFVSPKALIIRNQDGSREGSAARTAPLAICLAALNAVAQPTAPTVDEILPTTPLTALRETELRAAAYENYLQRYPGEVGRLTGETP